MVLVVIHDSDGVRPLLLWEGQLKRMSHHPRLLVISSDQFHVLTFGDDVLQSVPLCFGMAYRNKHLMCQRSGYALVLPSPSS